jgi:hypothetical protein
MQKILSGAVDYIAACVISINQKRRADASAVERVNSTHGAVSGIVV